MPFGHTAALMLGVTVYTCFGWSISYAMHLLHGTRVFENQSWPTKRMLEKFLID